MTKIYELMPDIQGEEMLILQNLCRDYSEEKLRNFATIYRTRRKDPLLILVLTLVGFCWHTPYSAEPNWDGYSVLFYRWTVFDWNHC